MRTIKVGDKIKVIGHSDYNNTSLYPDIPLNTIFVVSNITDHTFRYQGGRESVLGKHYHFLIKQEFGIDEWYYRSDELNIAFVPVNNIKVYLNKTGRKYE